MYAYPEHFKKMAEASEPKPILFTVHANNIPEDILSTDKIQTLFSKFGKVVFA